MAKLFRIVLATFLLGLAGRLALIAASPRTNIDNTDLEMNVMIGRVVAAGVNPYDPLDHIALRAALKEQTRSLTFRLSQAFWDYVVCSLLPLNLLYLGAISALSPNPVWMRVAFALADSAFGALVMWFVLRHWPRAARTEAIVCGAALGAASMVMLQWGVHSPQDKGFELLLMTGALMALLSERPLAWLVAAPLLLGLSVAYKAVGAFLVPLFFYYAYLRTTRRSHLAWFAAIFAVAAVVWYVPYGRAFVAMATQRLGDAVSFPSHASPFIWVTSPARYETDQLEVIRRALWGRYAVGAFGVITLLAGLKKRTIDPVVATATLLMLFCCVALVNGGLDRINMAIITGILLIGMRHPAARRVATLLYVVLGMVSVTMGFRLSLIEERIEAVFVAIDLVLLLGFLAWLACQPPASTDETMRPQTSGNLSLTAGQRGIAAAAVVIPICIAAALTVIYASSSRPEAAPTTPLENPFRATWEVNRARSQSVPWPLPTHELAIWSDLGSDIVIRFDEYDGRVRVSQSEYMARWDGAPHRLTAASGGPVGRFHRVNEYIVRFEIADRIEALPFVTGTMRTSLMSTVLDVDFERRLPDGSSQRSKIVFDRVSH